MILTIILYFIGVIGDMFFHVVPAIKFAMRQDGLCKRKDEIAWQLVRDKVKKAFLWPLYIFE